MKALQKEVAWVEKQFLLAECKKLTAEKKKMEVLRGKLQHEGKELQKLDKKLHSALSRKALLRVKQQLQEEINKVKRQATSLENYEKQLQLHFKRDRQAIIRKEKERLAFIKRGMTVI